MKNLKFLFLGCGFLFSILFPFCSFAQDNNKLVTLSKEIIEAKTDAVVYVSFEELKDLYFKEDKYSQLLEFIKSLSEQRQALAPFVNYYTALARYHQLKYLEKTQEWDEYFSEGNNYRDQITASLQKVIDSTTARDALNIYSQLLLWQFHKDQQDTFVESSLLDLMNGVLEYAKDTQDIKPVKAVADRLLSYGERSKSKELYQIYVNRLMGSVKEDEELETIAFGFYKEANLELSEAVYDIYIERVLKTYPKERLIPVLVNIVRNFSSKDEGQKDASYAEKIFNKIEEMGTKDTLDEELMYLRAFNTEKMKNYPKAKDLYFALLEHYPQTNYANEAEFKMGIIFTYILRDIKAGRDYFTRLSGKEALSPQVISSLYQLGLLSQWENDSTTAKDYYNRLVEKAGSDFRETVTLVQERMKETTESKPMEYNLKTFLDASLKEENPAFASTRTDLNSSRYRIKKNESIDLNCTPYTVESGCMRVEVRYLWSGDLGTAKPSIEKSEFNTTYVQRGTKVINLAVVSPSGSLDRSIEIVDVY